MLTVAFDATDASGPDLRGWGRYARCLLDALPGAGVDVRAFAARGPLPEVWFEQFGLPARARRARADVIHAPSCFLPLRRSRPGVVTVHDLAFEDHPEDFAPRPRAKFRFFTPRAARSAERIVCPSEFTRDDVCARYGVDPAKVRVIPEAPALALGDDPPPPGPYVLGVGDLRRKKNWGVLVDALARLDVPHRLILAGADAGEGPALAGRGVEITGYVTDARLDALMRGAAALVHPSLYEGFGLVLVEAMARGCPVLAADATALPATVADAGVLFDPRDPDDLAAKLAAVLADP
ncbi:MAG: glycosyl transferase group 1, partial [Solirubrobacterales bacterium]|nr:glycosyl transferase group 1 [Solirubrobacterales bacterium]